MNKFKYKRYCLQCKKELVYKLKSSFLKAEKLNKLCISCCQKKYNDDNLIKFNKNINKWERKCPKCNSVIYNKNKKGCLFSIRKKKLCRSCAGFLQEKKGKYINCSQCRKKFYIEPHQFKKRKYCSSKCASDYTLGKTWEIRYGKENAEQRLKILLKQNKNPDKIKKTRLTWIKKIKENKHLGFQFLPWFNKNACKIIDDYGKQNGYNFQHAMNGGEFYIKELGYWVDGYDKKKNTVIEVDERHHFKNGTLKQKDTRRQLEIETHLHCNFIRLKYDDYKLN